jgi:hypothetical protein
MMVVKFEIKTAEQHDPIHHHDDERDGDDEIQDEPFSFFSGFVLLLEKIHVR